MIYSEKKQNIKRLTSELLENAVKHIKLNIDKTLDSGSIDIDSWSPETPMLLPKTIITAVLLEASTWYLCKGTSYEKQIKKDVDNIRLFL